MEKFSQYSWPGNVRELENVIERLVVLGKTDVIREEDLPPEIRRMESRVASIGLKLPDEGIDLEGVEKELLLRALEKHGWNQTQAAKYLNISRKTLIGSVAESVGKRAVEKAAPWKSPKAGLSHSAWKSRKGGRIPTFATAPATTG